MNLNKIEKRIIQGLNSYSADTLNFKDKVLGFDCTHNIKSIVGNIGKELKFGVCARGNAEYESEWLFDMVWYTSNNIGIKSLELALESELCRNLGQVKYDFDKLLVTNAKLRMLICMSMGSTPRIEEIKELCSNWVSNYDLLQKGSRFLVLIWDDYYSGKFIPHLIIK